MIESGAVIGGQVGLGDKVWIVVQVERQLFKSSVPELSDAFSHSNLTVPVKVVSRAVLAVLSAAISSVNACAAILVLI